MELFFLQKLQRQQEKRDRSGRTQTEARSLEHTASNIQTTALALHILEPSIPAIDIARRLFPNLETYAPRLHSHIIESCSKLREEPNPTNSSIAEAELVDELKVTIQLYESTNGAAFAGKPLAHDTARRSKRMGYRRFKGFNRGIERTYSKQSIDARIPLDWKDRWELFEAPLTPPPIQDCTGIVKLYRWSRGR